MPFAIKLGIDGQPICPCCRDGMLWHCKRCWDNHHNGKTHNDYIPPKYYGQRMCEEIEEKMEKEHGIPKKEKIIKKDLNRKYKEGDYPH